MPKLVYVGPGTGKNERTLVVSEAEVLPLEKTGLWKLASAPAEPKPADKPESKPEDKDGKDK